MKNLTEIRFVSTNFYNLQGLRTVPISLYLVLICFWASGLKYPLSANSFLVPLLGLIGTSVLLFGIDKYYLHTFGRVQRTPESRRLERLCLLVTGILALGAVCLDLSFKLPISFIGLVTAASLLADYIRITWLVKGRFLFYYPLGAILLVVVSILPLLGVSNWWYIFGLKTQLIGVATILGLYSFFSGIWGHLFLVRTLPSRA